MTSAYSVFPNGGVRMRPYPILKISDRDGNLLEESRPDPQDAIRADTAFVMTNLLRGVVQRGTAGSANEARLAARRQDGNDRRLRRCVVHRLRSRHHRRRVGGPRRAQADRPQRDRRRRGAAHLDRVHARLHRDARSEKPARLRRRPATSSLCRSTRAAATSPTKARPASTKPSSQARSPARRSRTELIRRRGARRRVLSKTLRSRLCVRLRYSSSSADGCPRVPDAFCIRYALMNGSRSPSSTRFGSPTSNFVRWSFTS